MAIQNRTSIPNHPYILRSVFFTFGSIAALMLLYQWAPTTIPEINRFLGMAVVIVGLLPGFFYLHKIISSPNSVGRLPLLPLIGVLYALYYGLPAITQEQLLVEKSIPISLLYVPDALKIVIAGWVFLLLSFTVSAPILKIFIKPMRLAWDSKRARFVAPIFLLIGFVINVSGAVGLVPVAFQQVIGLMGMFFELGMGIYILLGAQGELGRVERTILWLFIVPYYFFSQLSTGSTSSLAFAFAFVSFTTWAAGYRIRWYWLVLMLFALVLFRGSIYEYRQLVWYRVSQNTSRIERSLILIQIAWDRVVSGGTGTVIADSQELQNRSSSLSTLVYVVSLTPAYIPYWQGESYATLPTTLIPRAIWPDKPTKNLGQDFGHRYLILAPSDHGTSINFPQLIEMYTNFGWTGILIGMAMLGLVYQMLTLLFNQPDVSPAGLLIGALIFKNLLNIESDFSLVFGAVLQTIIILYVIFRLIGATGTPINMVK